MDPILLSLRSAPESEQRQTLTRCCGSSRWVEGMISSLEQLKSDHELLSYADRLWATLKKEDFLEAFSHHPQIGADPEQIRKKFAATEGWSSDEQSGMSAATTEVIDRLAQGNRVYIERFGYLFIVCATGKSASEMLSLLEVRLNNDPEIELYVAAAEQAKITKLRLEKSG